MKEETRGRYVLHFYPHMWTIIEKARHEQVVGVPQRGETVYVWVISSTTLEDDPSFPHEPEWRILPKPLLIAIEREFARYRKKIYDAKEALARRSSELETVEAETNQKKIRAAQKRVTSAERAVESMKQKSMATLVFDKTHGVEAKQDWYRSDFFSDRGCAPELSTEPDS